MKLIQKILKCIRNDYIGFKSMISKKEGIIADDHRKEHRLYEKNCVNRVILELLSLLSKQRIAKSEIFHVFASLVKKELKQTHLNCKMSLLKI